MATLMKHNPAFLMDDELIRTFVVRGADLALVLEALRDSADAPANQHILLVGPRGSGKTTLVQRVAAELRRDPELGDIWFPVVFSEEAYTVASAGQFWLEALLHLADATGDARWEQAHAELLGEPDEERLRVRALARLMDAADERSRRILLVVENLQMLLGDGQLTDADGWALRHTLQSEPRLMLLATAPTRFEALTDSRRPMYDLFRVHYLQPLTDDECRVLWRAIAGSDLAGDRIRPVRILTGGNPRLVVILAAFAGQRSFRQLMLDLAQLVDEHTTYFKANVEELPPFERKVFVTLADLWAPSTAREIAARARMNVNKVSALLNRLMTRGAVSEVDQIGRVKLYQVTERMYNIYHLMRRRGAEREHVRALVEFMVHFYDRDELEVTAVQIASEACALAPNERRHHFHAFTELVTRVSDRCTRLDLIQNIPTAFFELEDAPSEVRALWKRLREEDAASPPEAQERALRRKVEADPQDGAAWLALGNVLGQWGRYREAEEALERAADTASVRTPAMLQRALALAFLGEPAEATALCKAIEAEARNDWFFWYVLGYARAVGGGDLDPAIEAMETAAELNSKRPEIWTSLGHLYQTAGHAVQAERALRQALALAPDSVGTRYQLALQVMWSRSDIGEALALLEAAPSDSHPEAPQFWNVRGLLLHAANRLDEAAAAFGRAIALGPDISVPRANLGLLLRRLGDIEGARQALRAATAREPRFIGPWIALVDLELKNGRGRTAALKTAEECFETFERAPHVLNDVAFEAHLRAWQVLLEEAVAWATEACAKEPDEPHFAHTRAALLGDLGRWAEALDTMAPCLRRTTFVRGHVEDLTEFFIEAAAAGEVESALAILSGTEAAAILGPVMTALRLLTGERHTAPQEVSEVARDVIARIDARRSERARRSPDA